MNEKDLARYLDETVDPAATVAAMPESALAELADALYRHLDTPSPAFGAHAWYIQVADELQMRRPAATAREAADSDDHSSGGLAGHSGGLAGTEVPAG
jgi:hypothetical protein